MDLSAVKENWPRKWQTRWKEAENLSKLMIVQVAFHVETTKRPFHGVDPPIVVPIQLLKMIVGKIRDLRIRHAGGAGVATRVEALSVLEHTLIFQIRPRLRRSFWRELLMGFNLTMALHGCLFRLWQHFFLEKFRLGLREAWVGSSLCGLLRLLCQWLGGIGCEKWRSLPFRFALSSRNRTRHGPTQDHGTGEYCAA